MSPGRPVTGVGALVLDPAGRVLLGRRIKAGEQPSWCLPGGHLEAGETFEAAAVRETAEESAVRITGERVFAVVVHTAGSGVTAGVVGSTADEPEVTEPAIFAEWRWTEPARIPAELFPASAALLDVWRDRPAPAGWAAYPVRPR